MFTPVMVGNDIKVGVSLQHGEGMMLEFFKNGSEPFFSWKVKELPMKLLEALDEAYSHRDSVKFNEPNMIFSGEITFIPGVDGKLPSYRMRLKFESQEIKVVSSAFGFLDFVFCLKSYFSRERMSTNYKSPLTIS